MNIETCKTKTPIAGHPNPCTGRSSHTQREAAANIGVRRRTATVNLPQPRLLLPHAVRIKSAELWLMLGEADEALRGLEALPRTAWNHSSARKVRVAALRVLDGRTGAIVQE
ncbi:MAG: hypothetical protein ABR924_14540 [Terracidiphilus sp.]|jgi:hypothetical protein